MVIHQKGLLIQIGKRIAWYRKKRGLTQAAFADQLHRSSSAVSRMERGTYNHTITLEILTDIANTLDISLLDLLEKKTTALSEDTLERQTDR